MMFRYNFKYELKQLLRSKWIQLLSIILLLLFGFSVYNGNEKVVKRNANIITAKKEVAENDEKMLQLLDSVEKGMQVSVSRWTIPTSPMAVGNYYPRIAAMESQPLAFVATGQADIFTHYVKPKVTGDDFALNFTEMTSPVQLLFGSFDLAFVVVYLLPLLIIAFSYNILSSERENGSLRLLASQPISISNWVFQKISLRFFWISFLVIFSLVIIFSMFIADWSSAFILFLKLTGFILAYMLFWFALAFLINLYGGSSAKNAITLLGLWVLIVLLIPSTLNQLSTTLYPMPSRSLMINEMRSLKAEVTKKQDEILDNYLRDHPEYAINDTSLTRSFYHRYMASQQLVKQELSPVIKAYENQFQNQKQWLSNFTWVSPAIVVQESLNKMSGTSAEDYEHFRKQVVDFAGTWREFLTPFLYNNQKFSQKDYQKLPVFSFGSKDHHYGKGALILVIGALLLFGIGYLVTKKQIFITQNS